jgi:integrase
METKCFTTLGSLADRVLSADEEARYLEAATAIGGDIQESYRRGLEGIRATMRGEQPVRPEDPFLLRDAATALIDCGLRPEECFRLEWEHVRDGAVHVPFGKTENARRTIPLTPRAAALLEMRRVAGTGAWVFPAPTRSGHIEKSSLKKQHPKACQLAKVTNCLLYTFRHTGLTQWAAFMDRTHWIPGRALRLRNHQAVRSPASPHDHGSHRTRAKRSTATRTGGFAGER